MAAGLLLIAFTPVAGQVTVPDRPAQPLFRGHQDEQRSSEIAFDPVTRTVTLKVDVQDLNGFFIPNLRRSHFAVFEDGIRQHNVSVEIEHAPVTLAVLMEMGGRSQQLNKTLAYDGVSMARRVLDVLGRDDQLAVFTYDDRLHTILDFAAPHDQWDTAFSSIPAPTFSEANFYDATMQVLDRLATMSGRKALLIVSTGIDTFSRATFDDLVKKAESARTPVYVVGFGDLAHQGAIDTTRGPLARVDWKQCARQLESLARISGGRAYDHASAGTYDDIMENLRVRYVITYVSSQPATSAGVRSVQVRLIDPKTDAPLRITDASGHRVEARAIAQATYTPSTASTRTSG